MADPKPPVPRRANDHIGPLATKAEKLARLQALTDREYVKLLKWSYRKAKTFSGKAVDVDHEDLLHEALTRAMKDTRRWYPYETDFLKFIGGCIRNIGFGVLRRVKETESADTLASPIDEEERLVESATLERVHDSLREQAYAVKMFEMLRNGYSRNEIQRSLGITKQKYDATHRWMHRKWEDFRYSNAWSSYIACMYDPFWDGELQGPPKLDERLVEQARAVVQAVISETKAMSQAADSAT